MRNGSSLSRRGFTLVELMVAMSLMVILTTILATFLVNAQRMYDTSVSESQVVANARTALDIIQSDLMHMAPTTADLRNDTLNNRPVALICRSLGYPPVADWNSANEQNFISFVNSPMTPVALDPTIESNHFLSFFAVLQYYDATGRMNVGPARVVYYLKRRAVGAFAGGYLMRRIEPYRWNMANPNPAAWTCAWQPPVEDDICAFVRGVNVYYLDRNYNLAVRDQRFIDCRFNSPNNPPGYPTNLPTHAGIQGLWDATRNAVVFQMDTLWQTYIATPFSAKEYLPPSLLIELLLVDANGQTMREVKREQVIWTTPLALPSKQ